MHYFRKFKQLQRARGEVQKTLLKDLQKAVQELQWSVDELQTSRGLSERCIGLWGAVKDSGEAVCAYRKLLRALEELQRALKGSVEGCVGVTVVSSLSTEAVDSRRCGQLSWICIGLYKLVLEHSRGKGLQRA